VASRNAFKAVPFLKDEHGPFVHDVCAYVRGSPKRHLMLSATSAYLDDKYLQLPSLNESRYERFMQRAGKALLTDHTSLCCMLHMCGKKEARQSELPPETRSLYLCTPAVKFQGQQFSRGFKDSGTVTYHTATVVNVKLQQAKNDLLEPLLECKYADGHVETLHKAQVLECMEAGYVQHLEASGSNQPWQLYDGLTQAKIPLHEAFLQDCRLITARLSELTQRDVLLPVDVNTKVESSQAELRALLEQPGENQQAWMDAYDAETQMCRGVPMVGFEDALAELEENKLIYVERLCTELEERVMLRGLLHDARTKIFDHTLIPIGRSTEAREARAKHGMDELKYYASRYHHLFSKPEREFLTGLKQDYQDFKNRVAASKEWQEMGHKKLFSIVYTCFPQRWPDFHEFMGVDRSMSLDTSPAERHVSTENRVVNKYRTRLTDDLINKLMFISELGPPMDAVDWGAVIKIWQAMKPQGRHEAPWKPDLPVDSAPEVPDDAGADVGA